MNVCEKIIVIAINICGYSNFYSKNLVFFSEKAYKL